ncbi:MAG: cysteine desulfurase family protein [Microgenomates group bacterium]
MKKRFYFDYAASTPIDPLVLKEMLKHLKEDFANSMSLHTLGQKAASAVEGSRRKIAKIINAQPEEIVFTSSATESNNLALKGVAFANKNRGKNHIVVSKIEHDCIMESARWLQRQGFFVDWLDVDKYGFVNIDQLKKLIRKETVLVSVIHANNEIGTIQDIAEIGRVCRKASVYFHTDASQSFAREKIDVEAMNIDLLTASSHKIYGPKGVAILYVKKGVIIEPILHGGGHEKGLRSSTLNVPAIVGFAKAAETMDKKKDSENKKLSKLRDYLISKILTKIPRTRLNGHPTKRLANNVNISFNGVEGESLLMELDCHGIEVSTGSACSSKNLMPSHVLMALGLPPQEAHGSLRITLGRFTKKSEIDYLIKTLIKVVKKLRKVSPF